MNCQLCRSELEDFLYGELSEARAYRIRAHLAECRDCVAVHDSLERENSIFAHYYERTALDPSREMWNAIRRRIRAEGIRAEADSAQEKKSGALTWLFRPSLLRQAAFSVLLVALTVAVTTWVIKRGRDEAKKGEMGIAAHETPVRTPQPATTPQAAPAAKQPEVASHRAAPRARRFSEASAGNKQIGEQIARAEREYRNAIRLLESAIASRKEALDPELLKQYENSLALIDSSIAASRRALRERPDDLAAGQFLLAAYARKVELMQDFSMR